MTSSARAHRSTSTAAKVSDVTSSVRAPVDLDNLFGPSSPSGLFGAEDLVKPLLFSNNNAFVSYSLTVLNRLKFRFSDVMVGYV